MGIITDRGGSTIRRLLLMSLALSAAAIMGNARVEAQSFDGITIIEFGSSPNPNALGAHPIAHGEYIVTFVSARGSYAAVVPRKGTHGGCQSLAVADSYTGSSVAFGIAADIAVRKQRLQTYCPPFTLRLEGPDTVQIEGPDDYVTRQKIVAQVPLRSIDFESAPFARHDLKGVRLGPVLNGEDVGPLPSRSSSGDLSKHFQRQVSAQGDKRSVVMGDAAPLEVTGWPWDVLYFAQYFEELEQISTVEAFDDAVRERYGEPSSLYEQSGYRLWAYDLDGQRLAFDGTDSNSCRATIEFWLKTDPLKRIHALNWEFNSYDLGPWGCSVMMELNPNRGSGGVSGYQIRAGSGYVWAINHFLQRIDETTALLETVQALHERKPKL